MVLFAGDGQITRRGSGTHSRSSAMSYVESVLELAPPTVSARTRWGRHGEDVASLTLRR
jgi:hypothetical protein